MDINQGKSLYISTAVAFTALTPSFVNLATRFVFLVANSIATFLVFITFIVDVALDGLCHLKHSDNGYKRGTSTGPGIRGFPSPLTNMM